MAVTIKQGNGNKPLPRKKRVLNRGNILSRSNDDVKNPSVTLMDIDTAIIFYFEKVEWIEKNQSRKDKNLLQKVI